MAARVYDIYDLGSPFVAPTAPSATAPATTARSYWQRLADSHLFNASVILLVFAATVHSCGTLLALVPLGQVTPSQNFGAWFGVIAGVLAGAGVLTGMLAAAVMRVRR